MASAASALAKGVAAAGCTALPVWTGAGASAGVASTAEWHIPQAEQAGLSWCALQSADTAVAHMTDAAPCAAAGDASKPWALWLAAASAWAT